MKRIILMLAAILLLTSIFSGCGNNVSSTADNENNVAVESNEDYFEWDGNLITGYSEEGLKQKKIVIPAKCEDFIYGCLMGNETVEEILFEEGFEFKEVTKALFSDCVSLKKVILPENIDEISDDMFNGCSALESFVIPDSVIEIGKDAFYDCSALKTVEMGDNVTTIKSTAFLYCESLESINLSSSLKIIENEAFEGNTSLNNVEFPDSLESIGERAFYNCHSLTKVELAEGLTTLGDLAFTYCDSLETIYLPESLTGFSTSLINFGGSHELDVYVKKGSFADVNFDEYNDGSMTKKYY